MNDSIEPTFHVPQEQTRDTVAAALRKWMPEQSWGQVKKMVQNRRVLVNGNLCMDESRRLTPGEVVKVLAHPSAPPPKEDDVRIRFLDPHLVIVEKPAGMTSVRHPDDDTAKGRRQLQPTLDECLPKIVAKREHKSRRPGLLPNIRAVHRLDRETSGLMVFARTVPAERSLGEQFRAHTVHRRYLAVVHGMVTEQTIESVLVRDRGDGRRGTRKDEEMGDEADGKRAVTHVKPVENLGDFTLIECRLETGRTHQIRIHLSELGSPVCGDRVYFPMHMRPLLKDGPAPPRLALHAYQLGVEHPLTGEHILAEMPLPDDLNDFVETLKALKGRKATKKG